MQLESIPLVANLESYDFCDITQLATDVNGIVDLLMEPCVVEVENTLLIAHALAVALDICRTVVNNYATLEELLRGNWSTPEHSDKWRFYETVAHEGPLTVTARRILLADNGEQHLEMVQRFYKTHATREQFIELVPGIVDIAEAEQAAKNMIGLRAHGCTEREDMVHSIQLARRLRGQPAATVLSAVDDLTIARLPDLDTMATFRALIAGFLVRLRSSPTEDFVNGQVAAVRLLSSHPAALDRYRRLLRCEPFYELNLTLLRTYHGQLLQRNRFYDSTVIMLCDHLLHSGPDPHRLTSEFLNAATLGGPEQLRIVQRELQNFR